MESKPKIKNAQDLKSKTQKEELSIQYFLYFTILLTIYLISLLIPTSIFMIYIFSYFLPNFLETKSFIAIFTELNPLISLLSMPLVLLGCYLLRLFFMGLITRILWHETEKRSPSKSGTIPRSINSKEQKFYHLRSFLIKFPKNTFVKGIFPWLTNFLYNFVRSNIVGRGTTIEESVGGDKFTKIGENCYIGVNSTLSSHLVEGVLGNISYFQINVGDNVTAAGSNQIGPGTEIRDNSYLLPLASAPKHNILKGNNYYFGIPLRRIFEKKVMKFLNINSEDTAKNKNLMDYLKINKDNTQPKGKKRSIQQQLTSSEPILDEVETKKTYEISDLAIDFTTSSAISRINIKFLAVYLPIFWLSGLLVAVIFYTYAFFVENPILFVFFLPLILFILWFFFILGCFLFSKLFLILVNLIHKPKTGIFLAQIGDTDFEFWCLRTELKKIVLWLMRNCPIPWIDVLAFRWFGIKIDFSSYLYDAWCDGEFVYFGRRVVIGQGATIMSSMVVGKYLIISKVIFDDFALIGGHTTVAPGTIVGKDTVIAAISSTLYNQVLEPGWIYMGIPSMKFKPNKNAERRRDIILKKDVDEEIKFEKKYALNIDEDKKETS